MNFLRELENFIIISINKTRWLIWNLKQQMFAMNNKKQPTEVFYKKAALKSFSKFTGKYLCSSLFLIKLDAFRYARHSNTGVFSVNIAKVLRKLVLKKVCERLLLNNVKWCFWDVSETSRKEHLFWDILETS